MNFSKIILLTCVCFNLLLTAACSGLLKRAPNAAITGKHYIMTLHGVRGTEQSFGDFHSLIKLHLEQIDPAYVVVPINMTYTTGLTDFNPHRAAVEINAKLEEKITQLNPEDKISVLAYSMGGQVGSIWFYDSLQSEKYKKYAQHTVKFISLGSPYWGSKEASLGTNVENMFGQMDADLVVENAMTKFNLKNTWLDTSVNRQRALNEIARTKNYMSDFIKNYDQKVLPRSHISFAELQALSMGSDVTSEIRLNQLKYKTNTKWISISTLINCLETSLDSAEPGCQSFQNTLFKKLNFDLFGKYTFGYQRRETDNSVITPSANARFLYAIENDLTYPDGYSTKSSQFQYSGTESDYSFYLAEGLHATLVPPKFYDRAMKVLGVAGESWESMADDVVLVYEKTCKTPDTCKHPSYKYIVKEFADCQRENSTCEARSEQNYVQAFFKDKQTYDFGDQSTLRSELHGFTVELTLRLPKSYDVSLINHKNIFDFLQADFLDKKEHLVKVSNSESYKILLARPLELGSLIINKVNNELNQNQLRVVMTGLIIPQKEGSYNFQELEKGISFDYNIKLPGLKSRKVQILVRPYFSTYVDLLMAGQ